MVNNESMEKWKFQKRWEICFRVIASPGHYQATLRAFFLRSFCATRSYVGTFALHNLLAAFRSRIRIRDGYVSRDIVHLLLKPFPSFGYFERNACVFPGLRGNRPRFSTITLKLVDRRLLWYLFELIEFRDSNSNWANYVFICELIKIDQRSCWCFNIREQCWQRKLNHGTILKMIYDFSERTG